MTVSTTNAVPPKPTKSRNPSSSVSRRTNSRGDSILIECVPRNLSFWILWIGGGYFSGNCICPFTLCPFQTMIWTNHVSYIPPKLSHSPPAPPPSPSPCPPAHIAFLLSLLFSLLAGIGSHRCVFAGNRGTWIESHITLAFVWCICLATVNCKSTKDPIKQNKGFYTAERTCMFVFALLGPLTKDPIKIKRNTTNT